MNLFNSSHKSNSDAYRKGWDLVFEKKKVSFEESIKDLPDTVKQNAERQRKAVEGR